MTDPWLRDRTYLEPLDLEGVTDVPRANGRTPSCRRWRPDRAQPRTRAARGRCAGRARPWSDRAPLDVIARRGGPRAVPRSSSVLGLRVPRSAIVTDITSWRGSRPLPRETVPHARRPRGGFVETGAQLRRPGRARPPGEPDRPGPRRGFRARGTSSSSRWCATATTMSSSSARSRTSPDGRAYG